MKTICPKMNGKMKTMTKLSRFLEIMVRVSLAISITGIICLVLLLITYAVGVLFGRFER